MSENMDKIIDEVIENADMQDLNMQIGAVQAEQHTQLKERLITVAVGGNSKEYLGKNISSAEIEILDDKQVAKLYARYEAYLGGLITRTLKKHMICAYTKVVEWICPSSIKLNNVEELNDSLNESPFVNLALTSLTCNMYHQYGHFLAPIEAALITSNHLVHSVEVVETETLTPTS